MNLGMLSDPDEAARAKVGTFRTLEGRLLPDLTHVFYPPRIVTHKMDSLDTMSTRFRPATDVEKFRLAKQEQQREEMQTEGSPSQSSKASSTCYSDTINAAKEIYERLEKHTNELVDLIEDLMQYTGKSDKKMTWEFVQPAVKALHQLPHTKRHVNTLPISKMTFVDVEDHFGLEYQNPLSGSLWEEPLPHIELPRCACGLFSSSPRLGTDHY